MTFLNWVLLTLIRKMDGQRSSGGVFHLLKGKRSAQTIQDAHLFQCSEFVSLYKDLHKEAFDSLVDNMTKIGLIDIRKDKSVWLTAKGEKELESLNSLYQFPSKFNGAKYEWSGEATIFWERLSLVIQSISFILRGKKNFIPVTYQQETQQWVKRFFSNSNHCSKEEMSEKLYRELYQLLNKQTDKEAVLFVKRLTSPERSGKTFMQLAYNYNNDPLYTRIIFQSVLHSILNEITKNKQHYPLLTQFIESIREDKVLLTDTAKETNQLLNQGKSLEEICMIRKLKMSTIEDHIIELAIYDPYFSLEPFMKEEELNEVLSIAKRTNTKRLKHIKDQLAPEFTYFKVRLAMTRLKERL